MKSKLYTIWVGGIEVNDYLFTDREHAEAVAEQYLNENYGDVVIEED
jgi:hypothetical protein